METDFVGYYYKTPLDSETAEDFPGLKADRLSITYILFTEVLHLDNTVWRLESIDSDEGYSYFKLDVI